MSSGNYWGGHILLDPSDMERMFSEEDGLNQLPSIWEEPTEDGLLQIEEVRTVLDKVPPREADFIELYFFRRLRQTAIADLFNISQPSVVYRLQRGARRIRYLLEMPPYIQEELEKTLKKTIKDELDRKILLRMLETTCQSEVARELGEELGRRITQGFVRHRFLRAIDQLDVAGYPEYVAVFNHVLGNSNILNSTCRASWAEDTIFSLQ